MRSFVLLALALAGLGAPVVAFAPAAAQSYRPHVYNPSRYGGTRSTANYRAAARAAAERRYCRQHPRTSRCRSSWRFRH